MSQGLPHPICVHVEVSQGLVSGDVTDLLQATRQVLSQGPHGYTFNLSVHDDGASSQTLHSKICCRQSTWADRSAQAPTAEQTRKHPGGKVTFTIVCKHGGLVRGLHPH